MTFLQQQGLILSPDQLSLIIMRVRSMNISVTAKSGQAQV